jgi:hypothetical protein
MEIVDPGKHRNLSFDDVIFHCSYEEVKSDMWTVFDKKSYMVIDSTDQESVCCTFDIGTAFHEFLNNDFDHIRKDILFMYCPSVEQFMLKVKKKQDLSLSKRNMSLMKTFDILLCCKLCGEEVYKLKEKMDFKTCNRDLTKVLNEHYRNGGNKCCQRLLKDELYVDQIKVAKKNNIGKRVIRHVVMLRKKWL